MSSQSQESVMEDVYGQPKSKWFSAFLIGVGEMGNKLLKGQEVVLAYFTKSSHNDSHLHHVWTWMMYLQKLSCLFLCSIPPKLILEGWCWGRGSCSGCGISFFVTKCDEWWWEIVLLRRSVLNTYKDQDLVLGPTGMQNENEEVRGSNLLRVSKKWSKSR